MSNNYILPVEPTAKQEKATKEISTKLRLHKIAAGILAEAGIETPEEASTFISPSLANLPSPLTMKGVTEAVKLVGIAMSTGQQIVIYGDYDADGVTSTVLLKEFFEELGQEPICHIPNRLTESYGLSIDSLDMLAKKVTMPALLITVDCGISNKAEVDHAKELGFTVIITDHHQPPEELPDAVIINPHQEDCDFSYKDLCGVGVAFFLAMALRRMAVERGFTTKETMPNLKDYLDIVVIGTVADVVPLTGINRTLVRHGLEVISERSRPGVEALCAKAKMEGDITSEDIGFQLAPRINVAGRLGTPRIAADLLCSDDWASEELADKLDQANAERKEIVTEIMDSAIEQAEKQVNLGAAGLVLYDKSWHLGVIGIVASKIVDLYQLPTFVLTGNTKTQVINGEITLVAKGSGRSVGGIDLHNILGKCKDLLIGFGGHAAAAGLSVELEKLYQFKDAFNECIASIEQVKQEQGVEIAAVLKGDEHLGELLKSLQKLEPFGQGNPEPVFLIKGVQLKKVKVLREHLKFSLPFGGKLVNGIGFFMADDFEVASGKVDFAFMIKENFFNKKKRVDIRAVGVFAA